MAQNDSKSIVNLSIPEKFVNLNDRLSQMEQRFSDFGYSMSNIVQTEIKTYYDQPAQEEAVPYLHTAVCIETIDPLKQGKVRFFSPLLHKKETPVKALPWAYPISAQGGFDDCVLSELLA